MRNIIISVILLFTSLCSIAQTPSISQIQPHTTEARTTDTGLVEVSTTNAGTVDTSKVESSTTNATPSKSTPSTPTTIEELLQSAEQYFLDQQYPMAVATYQSVIEKGEHSSSIYYNLGCAYFQQGQIGKSVLNFARANALDPTDADIQHNLELALAKTKDKIEPSDKFILVEWLDDLSSTQSSSQWAITALILFALTASAIILWLITERLSLRKLGFFSGLITALAFLLSLACGSNALDREATTDAAVIMNNAVSVKSSPSNGGKDIFILHEGTEVEILQTLDTWSEVKLKDGNRGWLQTSSIEQLWK